MTHERRPLQSSKSVHASQNWQRRPRPLPSREEDIWILLIYLIFLLLVFLLLGSNGSE
jgi:hypothetical protein